MTQPDHMTEFIRHALGSDPPWWAESMAEYRPGLAKLQEKASVTGGVLIQHPRTGRLVLVERRHEP